MVYQMIQLKTVWNKDSKFGGLSIIESERDIPFAIKRIYCIYETKDNQHTRFDVHEKDRQLLFCPYGAVDVMLTDETEKKIITLDNPSKGLIINSELCWEIIWKNDNSVLCVASSEYAGSEKNIQVYDDLSNKKTEDKDKKTIGGYCTSKIGNVLEVKKLKFSPAFLETNPNSSSGGTVKSIVVEGMKDVPFEIRRIFYIFGEGNVGYVRGRHANRKSEFVLFNISGRSKVKVIDEDLSKTVYELNEPRDAVYLPRMIWKEMYDFTPDSVLMVVTNEYYDAAEYVRDFDTFAEEIRELKKTR